MRINGPGQWNGLGKSKCGVEVTVQPAVFRCQLFHFGRKQWRERLGLLLQLNCTRHTWNNQVEETFNELTVWYGRIRYNRSNNEGNLPETIPQGKNVSDMQQKLTRRDLLRIPL